MDRSLGLRRMFHLNLPGLLVLLMFVLAGLDCAGQAVPAETAPEAPPARKDPVLVPRPPAAPGAEAKAGTLHLDLVVTDAAGKLVSGLEKTDFTVLDNHQPQSILSFGAYEGSDAKSKPPAEVILVIDAVNAGLVQVGLERAAIERFLQENGGHLAQPVSIFWFTDAGLKVQPRPSTDGNGMAKVVHDIQPAVHTIHSAAGGEANLETHQLSLKSLLEIADFERKRPGRKILVWAGPGWPFSTAEPVLYDKREHDLDFEGIQTVSNTLREARMEVCSAGGGDQFFVKDFLKGVRTAGEAKDAHLSVQVLAINSGGLTLNLGNSGQMEDLIHRCVADSGAFYSLSFDPPQGGHPYAFHELNVQVNKPGLTVRTNAGYYAAP
jgi:VWFA-related protein